MIRLWPSWPQLPEAWTLQQDQANPPDEASPVEAAGSGVGSLVHQRGRNQEVRQVAQLDVGGISAACSAVSRLHQRQLQSVHAAAASESVLFHICPAGDVEMRRDAPHARVTACTCECMLRPCLRCEAKAKGRT